MTSPNCPYCGASADNFANIEDKPAEDWDAHYVEVTCGDCGDTYELCYDLARVMHWDESGEPSITRL